VFFTRTMETTCLNPNTSADTIRFQIRLGRDRLHDHSAGRALPHPNPRRAWCREFHASPLCSRATTALVVPVLPLRLVLVFGGPGEAHPPRDTVQEPLPREGTTTASDHDAGAVLQADSLMSTPGSGYETPTHEGGDDC
jgi:hypothetical protein